MYVCERYRKVTRMTYASVDDTYCSLNIPFVQIFVSNVYVLPIYLSDLRQFGENLTLVEER